MPLTLFEKDTDTQATQKVFMKKKRTRRVNDVKKTYKAIRRQSKCVDCGWKRIPALLEFHHLEEGKEEPTRTRRSRTVRPHTHRRVEKMEEELAKGDFLCPTCHKCRHYNEELDILDTANKNLR
jgi:hypothetical protein